MSATLNSAMLEEAQSGGQLQHPDACAQLTLPPAYNLPTSATSRERAKPLALDDLPDDVLQHICNSVDFVTRVRVLPRVCPVLWHTLQRSDVHWKVVHLDGDTIPLQYIALDYDLANSMLQWFAKRHDQVRELHIHPCGEMDYRDKETAHCEPNRLDHSLSRVPWCGVFHVLSSTLQSVNLSAVHPSLLPALCHCTNITHCTLQIWGTTSARQLEDSLKNFSRLSRLQDLHLDLAPIFSKQLPSSCSNQSFQYPAELFALPNLINLELHCGQYIPSNLAPLQSLQNLRLYSNCCPDFPLSVLSLPGLRSLVYHSCWLPSTTLELLHEMLTTIQWIPPGIGEHLSHLSVLEVRGVRFHDPQEALKHASELVSLSHLAYDTFLDTLVPKLSHRPSGRHDDDD